LSGNENECKPLKLGHVAAAMEDATAVFGSDDAAKIVEARVNPETVNLRNIFRYPGHPAEPEAANGGDAGRGLHSFTSELNLSNPRVHS
jgi:hypothetical protein